MQYPDNMLGNKIRKLREDRNISRDHMAEYLGISKRTYEKIETGERSPTVVEADVMAKHLEVEPEDLLYHSMSIVFNDSDNNAPFNRGTIHFQTIENMQKLYDDLFEKERAQHRQLQQETTTIIEQQRHAIEKLTALLKDVKQ